MTAATPPASQAGPSEVLSAIAAPQDRSAEAAAFVEQFRGIDWWGVLEHWGLKLLAALVIFYAGRFVARWLKRGLERVLERARVERTVASFLANIAYVAMLVLILMTALSAIGVPTTSMFAILGAAGLAVGLALKDSLSNIASGVMLVILRPFRDGDYVLAGGMEGTVEEIRIFQTRLRTVDNRLIFLPNSTITAMPIINFTAKPQRRIDIVVGVGYDDDLKQARSVLLKIAAGNTRVLPQPEPAVQVLQLADSSVNLQLSAWVSTPHFAAVKSDLTEAVRTELIDNGLHIPYPQRDLHVYHRNVDGTPLSDIVYKSVADDGDVKP